MYQSFGMDGFGLSGVGRIGGYLLGSSLENLYVELVTVSSGFSSEWNSMEYREQMDKEKVFDGLLCAANFDGRILEKMHRNILADVASHVVGSDGCKAAYMSWVEQFKQARVARLEILARMSKTGNFLSHIAKAQTEHRDFDFLYIFQ